SRPLRRAYACTTKGEDVRHIRRRSRGALNGEHTTIDSTTIRDIRLTTIRANPRHAVLIGRTLVQSAKSTTTGERIRDRTDISLVQGNLTNIGTLLRTGI